MSPVPVFVQAAGRFGGSAAGLKGNSTGASPSAAASVAGAGPVMLTEQFPTRLRSTPVGIGYNISAAIFGGFAPFICTWLVRQTGDAIAPNYFLLACALVSLLTVTQLRDRTNVPLDEL